MAYIDPVDYGELTGRPMSEASVSRILRASLLLDARIGNYPLNRSGWKLDVDSMPEKKRMAVKDWVSQMVAFLRDNNDALPSASSISLGRFSVTSAADKSQKGQILPESLLLSDAILVGEGLIRSKVRI